jgi:hypothetical protein
MAGRQPFGKVVAGHGGTCSACPVRLPVLVSATAKTLPETSLAAGTHRHPRCNRRNSLSSLSRAFVAREHPPDVTTGVPWDSLFHSSSVRSHAPFPASFYLAIFT